MELFSPALSLQLALSLYAAGIVFGLLMLRRERAANVLGFGCAAVGGVAGMWAAVLGLLAPPGSEPFGFELWSSLVPYVKLSVRLDPLSAFFLLIVSGLALALSVYSFGYARGFYGRKSVGVLAAFYNAL